MVRFGELEENRESCTTIFGSNVNDVWYRFTVFEFTELCVFEMGNNLERSTVAYFQSRHKIFAGCSADEISWRGDSGPCQEGCNIAGEAVSCEWFQHFIRCLRWTLNIFEHVAPEMKESPLVLHRIWYSDWLYIIANYSWNHMKYQHPQKSSNGSQIIYVHNPYVLRHSLDAVDLAFFQVYYMPLTMTAAGDSTGSSLALIF